MKPALRSAAPPSFASALEPEARECARLGVDPALFERALIAGAREFLLRPGKAFRARLVETSYVLCGGDPHALPRASLEVVELMHGGSLIVDDIQDDGAERRGAPALHRVIGTPRALNTGNWLYFVALSRLEALPLDGARALELTRAAHRCFLRCHEGQALDLTMRIGELKRGDVAQVAETTSRLKTGALMAFAAQLGAGVAEAPLRDQLALARFGEQMGVALQMLDDLGSCVCGERREKGLEDLRGQRVSWVWVWASERLDEVSFKQLTKQTARGEELAEVLSRLADGVEALGRERVRRALAGALAQIEPTLGGCPAFEALAGELARLEKSYG